MKKKLLISGMLLISFFSFSQSITVDMGTGAAGTLADKIQEKDRADLKELTIIGEINAVDFRLIRDELSTLQKLNILDTKIMEYIGEGGTYAYGNKYKADHLPMQAFDNKISLESVVFPKGLKQVSYLSISRCGLQEVDLTHTVVERIENSGIFDNSKLRKILLPATIKKFDENSIIRNDILLVFALYVDDPQKIENNSFGMFGVNYKYDYDSRQWITDENGNLIVESIQKAPSGATLFVPEASIDKYKNAETWNTFNYIAAISDLPSNINKIDDHKVSFMQQDNSLMAKFEGEASINLYTIDGRLIDRTEAENEYQTKLEKGLYIITINNGVYKICIN